MEQTDFQVNIPVIKNQNGQKIEILTENGQIKLDNENKIVTEKGSIRNIYVVNRLRDPV